MDSWFAEYDELVAEVEASSYQTFSQHLQRWLDFIDEHPGIGPHIALWERSVEFGEWYTAALLTKTMDDPGKLNWPRDEKKRIGLHFCLFRDLASDQLDVSEFADAFFIVPNDFDSHVARVADQVFRPFARELRRAVQRLGLTNQPGMDDANIPASDRVVTLNHNSAEYGELTEKLKSIGEKIGRLNDYPDPAAKDRHTAELSAAQRLLKSTTVRVAALMMVLVPTLKWLSITFAEGAIGDLAGQLLKLLGAVLGVG